MNPVDLRRVRLPATASVLCAAVAAALLLAPQVHALPNDREQPVKVSADKLEANRNKNLSVYSGNVVISQGSLQIRADRVEVHGNAKGEINKVVATGAPAHFQQQVEESTSPVKARAKRIEFLVSSDALQLSGEAFVDRDGNTLSAERIDYDLKSEQMQAQGQSEKERVEMIWKPEAKSESKPAENGQ
ncbi:lipopolysaccharide transport periplasmic protein LptA [Microbulbifer harenosus]|uniref:Lipopolysaccharide export system protein LptA n=1 Tax=Microbulbifer harenosus TaxID=2576840 RepID=A0ABY2UHB3_9GAMM|nr:MULTISPECIES: lipopolysaccharide transport periplasmic protein LptA [Microbulbifer]QIL88370.1 lipopolysaccharide transport periplasmic protein LptA [Microbulbifer sp. SH-1]TLM76893.1 lipopolysaccharide transport periplasmic protein LptA [Microbulbifer harenosus]